MQGYQLTFLTQQNRRHGNQPLARWLVQFARELGATGGTLIGAGEGYGHAGRFHSAHFFELGDQPIEVAIAVDAPTCERLLEALRKEPVDLFYIKTPVEFGRLGMAAAAAPDTDG